MNMAAKCSRPAFYRIWRNNMSEYWILAAILLPIFGGVLTLLIPFKNRKIMMCYLEIVMLTTSAIVWKLILIFFLLTIAFLMVSAVL